MGHSNGMSISTITHDQAHTRHELYFFSVLLLPKFPINLSIEEFSISKSPVKWDFSCKQSRAPPGSKSVIRWQFFEDHRSRSKNRIWNLATTQPTYLSPAQIRIKGID